MKISCCFLYFISRYGYPPTISDMCKCIDGINTLGFQYLELEGIGDGHMEEVWKNRSKLKTLCQERGMTVVNFGAMLPDMVSLDKGKQKKALETFHKAMELARYFNSGMIQLDSFTPPLTFVGGQPYKKEILYGQNYKIAVDPHFKWKDQWQVLVENISLCNGLAKKAGLKLVMEPRVGENISNTDAVLRLMDAVNDDNFGVVFDTGHQNAQKEILALSVEKLGSKIFYVHVADNDGCSNQHLPLGQGTIDWQGVFSALKKHGFQGYVAVDVGNVPDVDNAYRQSKKFLEDLGTQLSL